ncbi:MAG: hypothetical protein IPH48_01095 [bacterium]|nr:hypothetical protein [bacterium]
MASYDLETVLVCGTRRTATRLMTEGNLGAVVRDIGDGANDDDFYPETDELSMGWGPVITTVDLDHPTTATAFLTAFKNRYPAYREGLWATAKNCGYEIDVTNPPAVSSLYSTSHATSGDSPDTTIDLVWTRAYDDASGVEGYGITIAGGIGLPSAVLDIGDVTSYSTSALPTGTYYFSIRTWTAPASGAAPMPGAAPMWCGPRCRRTWPSTGSPAGAASWCHAPRPMRRSAACRRRRR